MTKPTLFLLLTILIASCGVGGFNRQRYTNFRHSRGTHFQAPANVISEKKQETSFADSPIPDEIQLFAERVEPVADSAVVLTAAKEKAILNTDNYIAEKQSSGHRSVVTAQAKIKKMVLLETEHEATEPAVGLSFPLEFPAPYKWSGGEQSKKNQEIEQSHPDVPTATQPDALRLENTILVLSIICYTFFAAMFLTTLMSVLGVMTLLLIVSAALILITLVLLITALSIGTRYRKIQRERGAAEKKSIVNMHTANIILTILVAFLMLFVLAAAVILLLFAF